MKLQNLAISNFKNVTNLEIEFNGNSVNLIGINGAGKSTVIDAIITLLKGKTALPKERRWQMVSENQDKCVIKGTLKDDDREITITRKINKKENVYLEIVSSDGEKLAQGFLDKIFNEFCLNPVEFSKLSGKEQALKLGIDTTEFDTEYKKVFDERTLVNRDLKKAKSVYDSMKEIEKVEKVSISELIKERDLIYTFNNKQEEIASNLQKESDNILFLKKRINDLKKELNEHEEYYETMTEPQNSKDDVEITNKISNAENTNELANAWNKKIDASNSVKQIETVYNKVEKELQDIKDNKNEFIQKADLPFNNMTIDENGGLLIRDKSFNENFFSHGEIINISCKLLQHFNPELKLVFIKDASLLDDDKMASIKELEKDGFQFIFEIVGKEKIDNNSILIKESEIVDNYEEKKDGGL